MTNPVLSPENGKPKEPSPEIKTVTIECPGAPFQESQQSDIPVAKIIPRAEKSSLWLLPILALFVVLMVFYQMYANRGITIRIRFQQGYSLKPGDSLKFRGISIGEIKSVSLAPDLSGILVQVLIDGNLGDIARGGSRFWIVRPNAGLSGIRGLDTVVGPRYIAVSPGNGPSQIEFDGIEEPPVLESISPGGVEIILQAKRRGSLRPGAPVSFRQVQIGTLLSVGLVGDAINVEARAYIEPAYVALVRKNSKFWNSSGVDMNLGLLDGFQLSVESLQTLLAGGVSMATPDEPGEQINTGQRFQLYEKCDKDWLHWQPPLSVGNDLVPIGTSLPTPHRIRVKWLEPQLYGFLKKKREIIGWGLQVKQGLLLPKDLLLLTGGTKNNAQFELAGAVSTLPSNLVTESDELAVVPFELAGEPWPKERIRRPTEIEDCFAIGDPAAAVVPLQASRLKARKDRWIVDSAVSVHSQWHGASVVSRKDGAIIGTLLLGKDSAASIALFTEKMVLYFSENNALFLPRKHGSTE